ncbi:hypothetical protein GOP47_0001507 [Adiantum capillus-veneris]|uniref:Uncharacterized protein n=1 Tax=Adiantum capillus-veneris TaxID=13818 RepID=A0A9D4V8H6_ADICA|nr:hypothetical protein GOP47_0001507 [Adiantum capillus-veneris]
MIVVYWPALIHVDILMSHGAVIYRSTELTPSSNSVWTSPIGAFSMGFFSLLPNTYYVGIWYSSLPSNQSIVWTANRNRSVGMNSILRFTHDGRLELISNNSGSVITIWAASTLLFEGIDSNASQAELLDTGNFVLRDTTSRVVWQSFDHPTDTLLPTQNFTFLHNSSSLVPWIAANDPSLSPKYSLVFGSGGSLGRIRLLFQDTFEYWSEPPPGIDDVLFNTSFTMDSMGTLSLYNGNGKQIWVNVSCNESAPATNSMRKLQLGVDGNLQVLTWSTASKTWKPLWKALYFQCDVFDTCGENSICNKNQDTNQLLGGGCPLPVSQLDQNVCTCPESFTRNGSKCDPPPSLNCSNYTSVMNQTSFGFPGSTKEDFSSLSFEECEEKCLHDCNCTAGSYANSSSSYANSSSSCWLFRTALHNGVGSDRK